MKTDSKHSLSAGVETGAIISAMIGTFFYTDVFWTELILMLALVLSVWRYTKEGKR